MFLINKLTAPHPQEPLRKGLEEAAVDGFSIKLLNELEINVFRLPLCKLQNRSPTASNDSQHGIHYYRQAAIIYEINLYTVTNNIIAWLKF